MTTSTLVPVDSQRSGRDVLNGRIGTRTNCIHEAMGRSKKPLSPSEIGEQAQAIAEGLRLTFNKQTYSEAITYNHLNTMRTRQYAERLPDGRWQLTETARRLIDRGSLRAEVAGRPEAPRADDADVPQPRKTDRQARLTLPDDFADVHVIVERVGENELRVRKARVRPKAFSLSDLLARVTDDNRHEEISTGRAVGREAEG